MAAKAKGKEEEIAGLLMNGSKPAELVHQGHARGTVYKVARRLREGSTPPQTGATDRTGDDQDVERDPEIVDLRKALRKAELERQIAGLNEPSKLEERLEALENEVKLLDDALSGTTEAYLSLESELDGSPLLGLRKNFKCSCGAKGMVATKVECTSCGGEVSWGWWAPDEE